jgi:mono/diheme cytochrome c family protein
MKAMVIALALALPVPLYAATNAVLESYRAAAQQEAAGFKDFSATRGEALYQLKTAGVSCSTCHGASPKDSGKHATTGKPILPMAPSANPERFTDAAKVEKWFKRNCNDVLKRPCTATEKGDFITYMLSVK